MIVRYLTKAEYGVFSYALSLVAVATTIVTLGTDRAVGRFLPIYQERGRPDAVLGVLLIVFTTIAGFGMALIVLVFGLKDLLSSSLSEPGASALLVILIILAPIQALDDVLMSGFAVFANPRAIFFRRYVLNPIMRISVVGLLIFAHQDTQFLAVGYVLSGALGLAIYGFLFYRLLRRVGMLPHRRRPQVTVPWREVLGFSLPLLSTDLIYIILNATDVIILGIVTNAETVASYRVIQPAAALNLIVLQSFTLLFTPAASRLFARGDQQGVKDLYWQTAAWVAVASFPIFALTFSLAEPLTVALYQERYASSAVYLAIIAIGRYFDAALGFNGLTVRVFGNVRAVVIVNLVAGALNLVLLLTLIPILGALGAALATTFTLLVFNTLKQYALYRVCGISMFDRRYISTYGTIVVATIALLVIQLALDPPLIVGLGMVAVSSAAVLGVGRSHLRLGETFPELARIPLVRRMLG